MTEGGRRGWLVVNPLPRALAHFEMALRAEIGHPLSEAASARPDIEVGGLEPRARLRRLVAASRVLLKVARDSRAAVVLWPVFGLADLALWRLLSRERRLVLVHDPEPLRRQHGYGGLGRALGRWGARGRRVEVVAHTRIAARSLHRQGISVSHVLAHPVLGVTDQVRRRTGTPTVLVLGQYKPSRDLTMLLRVAEQCPHGWSLCIAGRGWPEVAGWQVTDRFLSENEMTEMILSAGAVLIPYRYYFQSGVATRAYECGVPVVGARHEYLESLYGSQWPGLVDDLDAEGFIRGIRAVLAADAPDPGVGRGRVIAEWQRALSGVSPEEGELTAVGS